MTVPSKKTALIKIITLLYRQSQLKNGTELNTNLVSNILNVIVVDKPILGDTTGIALNGLKMLATNLLYKWTAEKEIDKTDILQEVSIICNNDPGLYDSFKIGIEDDLKEPMLISQIDALNSFLISYYREISITTAINELQRKWNLGRDQIEDVNLFLEKYIKHFEILKYHQDKNKKHIISRTIIGDDRNSIIETAKAIRRNINGTNVLVTGWKNLNILLEGGFRRGEYANISGLKHNGKSLMVNSLIQDIALFNKPVLNNPLKKPLILVLSFEDPDKSRLKFWYTRIKYMKTGNPVNLDEMFHPGLTDEQEQHLFEEIEGVVSESMRRNGFYIDLQHINPNDFTHLDICNKVIEAEAEGYEVIMLVTDYLAKCKTTLIGGKIGDDIKDAADRTKNFCREKDIFLLNAHQISGEGKTLLRGQITDSNFLTEIMGKGYYDGCKALDQDMDIDLYVHKVNHEKNAYLSVGLGKHRDFIIPSDTSDCVFFLPFQKNKMPILPDFELDLPISYKKLPYKGFGTGTDILL